jgi:phosphopantetheinyl transferase
MADVSILPSPSGRPIAMVAGAEGPLVSLAHKGLLAVAVAADPGRFLGVGIDVEPCTPMDAGVMADSFDEGERAIIDAAWGAKESVGKATGRGVVGGPRSLRIEAIDTAKGRVAVVPQGAMSEILREFAPGVTTPIPTFSRVKDAQIVTLCLLSPTPP